MDPSKEIQFEILPLIRIYKDGTVERLTDTGQVPPGHDPITRTSSKDVVIDPAAPVLARLYLPESASTDNPTTKLPILMFFHGGGFAAESAFSPLYHAFLNSLSARANILVVSVEYRLAPENPIPAAYDDSLTALKWAVSGSDVWLSDHGDTDRVFISGDSSGGNMAHNVALMDRAGVEFGFEGLVLINSFFWGTVRLDSELNVDANSFVQPREADKLWKFICGDDDTHNDDPRLNPLVKPEKWVSKMDCRRIFVAAGGKDVLRDRGRAYCEILRANGWEGRLELLEFEGEDHGFFLFKPECQKSIDFMNNLVEFLKSS